MTLDIQKDYKGMSIAAADLVQQYIMDKPDSMICIASGSTPLGLCQELVGRARRGVIDLSQTTFVALDEWVGMGSDDEGSCQHFLKHHLFEPLDVDPSLIIQFDAKATDLQGECDRVNLAIAHHGGLDIMIVGIGLNGHLGLNEPGTPFDTYAHLSVLEEITKSVGQKYFTNATPLSMGITLGLQHLTEAKLPVLIASGENKAIIIKNSLEGPIGPATPGSLFQSLQHSIVILDVEAAQLLNI